MYVLILLIIAFLILLVALIVLYSRRNIIPHFKLRRSKNNPLLRPERDYWQAQGTFNPAAIMDTDGRVHMLYRAIGDEGISRLGYAHSKDGVTFDNLPYPVFAMRNVDERKIDKKEYNPCLYPSGGSWSGSEDPRMVEIDGRVYVTFNIFNGWDFVRVGVTSLKSEDFFNKRFNWTEPFLISPKKEIHKNWVLFPQKFDGKFAILHSITPEIQIDYVSRLEELSEGTKTIKSFHGHGKPHERWDTWVRSAGPPPLKTNKGWLVLYHAIEKKEPHRYKLGAMLLDLKNPKKIIARAPKPILVPDMWYENDWKPGIIYACGAVIKNGVLRIYYGGGDRHVCSGEIPLEPLLDWMLKHGTH